MTQSVFWHGQMVRRKPYRKIVSLDAQAHSVTLGDGTVLTYEKIVLATETEGFFPPIPDADKLGVYTVHKSSLDRNNVENTFHRI